MAHDHHDVSRRHEAKRALKYPPVRFNDEHRAAIAYGIGQACEESVITVNACAIGYDHVHVVVARHARPIEGIIGQFKTRANQRMKACSCHPMASFVRPNELLPSPWSDGRWKVFINNETQLRSAIDYVDRHPEKEGLGVQRFDFVRRP